MTDPPSRQRTRQDDSYCKGPTCDLTSGHESQTGLDTNRDWLTDRRSKCDFDFDLKRIEHENLREIKKQVVRKDVTQREEDRKKLRMRNFGKAETD
jgi:hypothetical protein